ncbi:helix-turn-helix domain-containing protein [Streptomyces melanosporofaciens]|uniref:helix-turn-helix domain-containing protein n=1 Tax=Streptomyces sp. NPDC021218 TaxID=3365119 RepID=UPI003795F011
MADDEEVQRVFDALEAVERIADPEARSRAQVQITAATRERAARWTAERAELANQLKAGGESVRGIAKRLGVKPSTVQDLLRGYKGSGKDRPRVEQEQEEASDG